MTTGLNTADLSRLLLGDTSLEDFWAGIWNDRSHLVTDRDPDTFETCVTMRELENLISHTRLPLGNFDMAHDQKPLEREAYCENGLINASRVYDLHEQGVTIILRAAHFWLPGLHRLCVASEKLFGCPAQANVYLTPPDNQSTPPHWDTHDLFVLQIAGSKRWPLFENLNNPRPLSGERFQTDVDPVGEKTADIELKAGDCLYLPRGEIHAPVSTGYSVHVALGISCYRWIDVIQAAMQRCLAPDSFLRQPVPPPALAGDITGEILAARKAMKKHVGKESLEELARAAIASSTTLASAPNEGRLLGIANLPKQILPNHNLRLADDMRLEVSEEAGRAFLVTDNSSVSFPLSSQSGLNWLYKRSYVTPAEFASKMGWDEDTALAVAESLISEGIFCRA